MKNLIENLALFLVAILSLAIVFFIIKYNSIDENDVLESLVFEKNTTMNTETKTKNYLDALEGYGDDTDVEVDARKEDSKNRVSITSELRDDILNTTVEDSSKSSYMENLNNYSPKNLDKKSMKKEVKKQIVKKKALLKEEVKVKKPLANPSGEPEKLEHDVIVDEVGMAIDALDL